MVSDEVQAKAWIPRLSGVQSLTALDLHGTLVDAVPEVRLTKEISGLVDSLAQGDFIGLLLIAVAATRIVMSAIDDATRHAVIVRLPRSEEAGELALCTDIDLAAPVTDFLRALHDELESAADVAWLDRSMVIDRLEAIGLPAARCLSQVAVQYTESGFDYGIPAQVRLTLRRVDRVFAVGVTGDGDSLPAGALALARCVAAAIAAIAVRPGQLASEVDVLGPDQRSELQSWAGMPCPGEFSPATLVDVVDHAAARGCDLDAVAARGSTDSW